VIDWLIWLVSDPWRIITFAGILMAGIGIGYFYQPSPTNQVCFLQPKTRSGYDLDVEEESALVLYVEKIKGLPWKRFLKYHTGYDIRKGKKVFTRYLAREGTLFTVKTEDDEGNLLKEPKKISPADYMKTILGEEVYNKLQPEYRDAIESAKLPITIKISDETPTIKKADGSNSELSNMTEDDYYRALEEKIPAMLGEGIEQTRKSPIIEKVAWAGTGFAICMALWVLKVFAI